MTQDQFRDEQPQSLENSLGSIPTYYALLDLTSTATLEQIRRAYRLKSKLYHPDTTTLPPEIAIQKFRDLNKAYAMLSNPEHRTWYDRYAEGEPFAASRQSRDAQPPRPPSPRTAAAGNLDPTERPLSPGELFALLLLGITFLICLAIAIILGIARGEMVLQASSASSGLASPVAEIRPRNDLASGKSVELKQKPFIQPNSPKAQRTKRSTL